jgi:plasmid stability protein
MVVDEFEVREMGVDESVVHYILSEVLAPEPEWNAAAEQGRFTEEQVREILFEALLESKRLAKEASLGAVDLESARRSFPLVVDMRFHCPVPFMIC